MTGRIDTRAALGYFRRCRYGAPRPRRIAAAIVHRENKGAEE